MKKNIKIFSLLSLIIIINVLLKIPGLFEPVSYGDECIYLTLGQAFNQGSVFYRDIHDNKPPLLYLIAALSGGQLPWFRTIMILWNTINLYLVFIIAKQLTKKELAGVIAAGLFAVFSLLPEGRVANGEIFMIMPATLGLLLSLLAAKYKKGYLWLLSGLSFSAAFLFKVPIGFDFVGFLLAVFILPKKKLKQGLSIFINKRFILTIFGFIVPIGLSIIYYYYQGGFTPYVRSALFQNIGYLSSWGGDNSGLIQRAGIVLLISFLIYQWRKKLGKAFYLPGLMTLFGLYGVFLSERPYPHYLMEIAPWAALMITVWLFQRRSQQLVIALILIFFTLAGVLKYDFWWYPHLPYYQNFYNFITGNKDKQEYFSYFGQQTLLNYQLAGRLKALTGQDDRIFVWGDAACIYALAERRPPGRYTVNYHIYDFNGYQETLTAIKNQQPGAIVILDSAKKKFPKLEKLIKKDYRLIEKTEEAKIYKKVVYSNQ